MSGYPYTKYAHFVVETPLFNVAIQNNTLATLDSGCYINITILLKISTLLLKKEGNITFYKLKETKGFLFISYVGQS